MEKPTEAPRLLREDELSDDERLVLLVLVGQLAGNVDSIVHAGGWTASPDQVQRMARMVRAFVLAIIGGLREPGPEPTEEQLDRRLQDFATQIVRLICGAPPMAN